MSRRKICYITGTRADFGLMRSTLQQIASDESLSLSILATGMHLSERYGLTVNEIEKTGLPAPIRIPVDEGEPSGAQMARNLGQMIVGFVDALQSVQPDIVLLLGDRGEMLAGAIAAVHLNIRIAHIHGGERSGTIDEPVRHAISKLSHIHLVASQESADRLRQMGENPADIHVVGAPGLVGLAELATRDRPALAAKYGFDDERPVVLLVMHPVVQEAERSGEDMEIVLQALGETAAQVIALKPNSDAGGPAMLTALQRAADKELIKLWTHFDREDFVSLMSVADFMIGNSSSGIIEAATFGTPVINLGSRQNLRQRNANVIDAPIQLGAIRQAIVQAFAQPRHPGRNVFGDGQASQRIVDHLRADFPQKQLSKVNAY